MTQAEPTSHRVLPVFDRTPIPTAAKASIIDAPSTKDCVSNIALSAQPGEPGDPVDLVYAMRPQPRELGNIMSLDAQTQLSSCSTNTRNCTQPRLLSVMREMTCRWRHGAALMALLAGTTGCQITQKPFTFKQPSTNLKPVSTDAEQVVTSKSKTASPSPSLASQPQRTASQSSSPTRIEIPGGPAPVTSPAASQPAAGIPSSATIRGQSGTLPAPGGPGVGATDPLSLPALGGQTSAPVAPYTPPTPPTFEPPTGYQPPAYQPPQYTNAPSGSGTSPLAGAGDYGSSIAPGARNVPYSNPSAIAPGAFGTPEPGFDPLDVGGVTIPAYQPAERLAPIDVFVQEARTGRVTLGGAVNSDLGVSGQLIIEERNFDILRFPRSWDQVWSGRAFRGGGQNFRAELMPGSQVQRYTLNWTEPHLNDSPYSLSVGGFLYSRQFRDWTEQRLGGRVALGYEITKDLSISSELRMEDVKIFDPRVNGVKQLDDALGSNDVYRGRVRLAHDTRDNPFLSTRGGLVEIIYDQVFGEYDYSRAQINMSRYHLLRERPDGGGRHVLASTWQFGVSGAQTPIFENFFAGGYSTLRGFSFRGASPVVDDVQVGGEFMFLGSHEYVFPITADETLRGIAFVDYGTVEQNVEINTENFRIAPGFGLRIQVPALGPAPLAFDFAFPVNYADTDDRQIFSFFMGLTRS